MAYTLNANDLGEVASEESNKSANLDHVTYPLSDSNEASVFDYSGVKRIITINGRKIFNTAVELWDWISDIDALLNSNQSTIVYHSDGWNNASAGKTYATGNFNVKVDRFRIIHLNEAVLSVTYILILFEGETGV